MVVLGGRAFVHLRPAARTRGETASESTPEAWDATLGGVPRATQSPTEITSGGCAFLRK